MRQGDKRVSRRTSGCWTLGALFNRLPGRPRLLFKGGTSLSKDFGLIERFSEEINVTVFRQDIGEATEITGLAALSGKKREARLDTIPAACQHYINDELQPALAALLAKQLEAAGQRADVAASSPIPKIPTARPPPLVSRND